MNKLVLGSFMLLAATASATAAKIETLVPSQHLQGSADKLRTGTLVIKEIQVPYGGRVRVTFEAAADPATYSLPPSCSFGTGTFAVNPTPAPTPAFQEYGGVVSVAAQGSLFVICNGGADGTGQKNVKLRKFRVHYDVKMLPDKPRAIRD